MNSTDIRSNYVSNASLAGSFASSTSNDMNRRQNGPNNNTTVSQIVKSEDILKMFVFNKDDINAKFEEVDWTPLFKTIVGGNNNATEQLLKMGADPNIKCKGETALFQAVEMEKINQIETLLKYGADPNISNNDNLTPLHVAVFKQNIQLVEMLLKSGSNPNAKNRIYKQTPVHFAIKNSVKTAVLLLLVQYNGSLSVRDKDDKRPIDYVDSDEMREIINKLKTQREDAFWTPQKERVLSIYSNPQMNSTFHNTKTGSGLTFYGFSINNCIDEPTNAPAANNHINLLFNNNTIAESVENNAAELVNKTLTEAVNNNQPIQETPVKTTNYILNKKILQSISDKKRTYSYHNRSRTITDNEEDDESKNNSNAHSDIINNNAFSPSDCKVTNPEISKLDPRFASFATQEAYMAYDEYPISPNQKDDGGISDINPLETIYSTYTQNFPTNNANSANSNYNSNTTPNDKDKDKDKDKDRDRERERERENLNNLSNQPMRREELSNFVYNVNTNNNSQISHISENENEESVVVVNNKEDQGEEADLEVDVDNINEDSLEENEEFICKDTHSEFNELKNFKFYENNDSDDLQYSPSKTSYIISDLPVTSVKKNNENSSSKKCVNRVLNFGSGGNSAINNIANVNSNNLNNNLNNNVVSCNNAAVNPNPNPNHNTNLVNKLKYHNKDNLKINTDIQPNQKINLNPDYVKKMNFSNYIESDTSQLPMSKITNSNTVYNTNCNTNCNTTQHNSVLIPMNKDEDKCEKDFPNKLGCIKKIYLNETINPQDLSNKTIIHYDGETLTQGNINCPYNNHIMGRGLQTCTNKKRIWNFSEIEKRNSPVAAYRPVLTHTDVYKNKKYLNLKTLNMNENANMNMNFNPHILNENIYFTNESSTVRSNISTKDAKKLHNWLNHIGMQNYYNNFLEKGVFDIDKLIEGMADPKTRMTYKDFEDLEVRRPGHIFRMLIQLEVDAKLIDEAYYHLICKNNVSKSTTSFNRNNMSCNLRLSKEKNVCCGLFDVNKVNVSNGDDKKNGSYNFNYDLITWLKKINLPTLRKNFLHNGFDSLEFFILQMFSLYTVEDRLLEDSLHIYNKKERRVILNQLAKEVKMINSKLYNNTNNNSFMTSDCDFEKENVDEGCKLCLIF